MKRLIPVLALLVVVAGALALTAGKDPAPSNVPQLTVPRMDGSGDFELASLASSDKPTLLWFWAPWCSICNGEAPKIDALAAEAGDDLNVVAIGGRDDFANGPAFVAEHGLSAATVLFDESLAVWRAYRIPGQPGAVLLDTDGQERGRWLGAFDTDLALAAAKELQT